MSAKKKDVETVRPGQHAAVQVALPDADVYYIDEKTKAEIERRKK